jgi:hypothetical protein
MTCAKEKKMLIPLVVSASLRDFDQLLVDFHRARFNSSPPEIPVNAV